MPQTLKQSRAAQRDGIRDEQFRRAARRQFAGDGDSARIGLYANVSRCEGGAYVDAIVWVPSEAAASEEKE